VHTQSRGFGDGIVLIELYDASTNDRNAELANLSTRMVTASGERTLTAGFVIEGETPHPVLLRGIGPGLSSFGVSTVINSPEIILRQNQTIIARNGDWAGQPLVRQLSEGVGAFSLANTESNDAAMVTELAPGAYTVQVLDQDPNKEGEALIEVYSAN
jgi:hypothetical protein